MMIRQVVVLGGGTAGLLAALTLRRRLPQIGVRLVRSPDIGVIGVGEGTTVAFPRVLFRELRMNPGPFYHEAKPIWKLGIRFLWGPRREFWYTFSDQFSSRRPDLPKNNGFYCGEEVENADIWSALMRKKNALPRRADGMPDFVRHENLAFHVENKLLVEYLEKQCRALGTMIIDGTVERVERGAEGVKTLILQSGEQLHADLFIDASGFRSELLGRALEEPVRSFSNTLFCDRAVIGGWTRTNEPIKPYTTCETMDAGWCWQIDHEEWINRGYVFSSAFISDDEARAELIRKNPQITGEPRVVKFRAFRQERMWVQNVVGIGNASGFVEPLEATAISTILLQCQTLANCLYENCLEPTPGMVALYNRFIGESWDEIRDFIALHYKLNTRLDTPFWKMCRAETDLGCAKALVEFYQENGPTALHQNVLLRATSTFRIEGYLAMLIGQAVPCKRPYVASAGERTVWKRHQMECAAAADGGVSVKEALEFVRRPEVSWG